jgi:hypothetical protein
MKRVLILVLAFSAMSYSLGHAQGREDDNAIRFNASVGIGTAFPFNPDEFDEGWNPSFGLMVDVGASRSLLELSANVDYSFFLAEGQERTQEDILGGSPIPSDANVLTVFLNLKIKPLKSVVRPYILVGAGYFRYWIVDQGLYENAIGFGGGAGVEVEIDKSRRIFMEGKNLHGRTRETARRANLELIPVRVGITFVF